MRKMRSRTNSILTNKKIQRKILNTLPWTCEKLHNQQKTELTCKDGQNGFVNIYSISACDLVNEIACQQSNKRGKDNWVLIAKIIRNNHLVVDK